MAIRLSRSIAAFDPAFMLSTIRARGFLFGLIASTTICADASETMDTVRQKAIATLATFASLEVRYHELPFVPLNAPSPKKVVRSDSPPRTHVWMKQGIRQSIQLLPWTDPESGTLHRSLFTFDGSKYFSVHFRMPELLVVDRCDVYSNPRMADFVQHCDVGRALGIYVWESQLTLVDLLSRSECQYLGIEEIEGHACHHVDFGEYEGYTNVVFHLSVWFDASHDFLPRQIRASTVRFHDSDKKIAPLVFLSVIETFTSVPDESLKRSRWFPKRLRSPVPLEIDEVKINHSLPVPRFVPEFAIGTKLEYRDVRETVPGTNRTRTKSEIVGGPAGIEARINQSQVAAKNKQAEEVERNRQASISRSRRNWAAILSGGFGVVAVAWFLWRRSSCWFVV